MGWLLRDGDVLAAVEVAGGPVSRAKGLLGRKRIDGAIYLPKTRSVHTMGMKFVIDVAFLDRDMRVVKIETLGPWRFPFPVMRARSVVEAEAGAFERWKLAVGDQLELRLNEGDGTEGAGGS